MTMEASFTSTTSTSGTTPRQKLGLSFNQKKHICAFHSDHPEMKQIDLIKYFTKQFDLPYLIPKSTISDLLKNKKIYLSTTTNTDTAEHDKSSQHSKLEESLYAWYLNEKSTGATVADTQLIEKAESLCKTLNLDGFKCSSGWLYRFKHRYELNETGKHVADDQSQDDDDQSQNNISDYMSQTDANNELNCMNSTSSETHSMANGLDAYNTNTQSEQDSIDYDQIKYNFLKLVKQFKIFEFDKFMKWLSRVVDDYNRIGYNIIGNLENELNQYIDNVNLDHDATVYQNPSNHQVVFDETNGNNGQYSPSASYSSADVVDKDDDANESQSNFYNSSLFNPSLIGCPSNRLFKSKINEQQINALETVFKQKQYLNQFEKEQLSNLLNITPLQVKSWFKNRRYRQKKTEHQKGTLEPVADAILSEDQQHVDTDDAISQSANETYNDNDNDDDIADSDSNGNDFPSSNHSILRQQLQNTSSTSFLAAAALAAVSANGGSPLFPYQQATPYQNSIKITKALNDELELVFDKQKYISNTQRDYLAEKFHVASAQITNWFQNKRRKLKRLERLQNSGKLKTELDN